MQTEKETRRPGRARGDESINNSVNSDFSTAAIIRRRFGTGIPAYEAARSTWIRHHYATGSSEYTAAMRKIARAVKV